ncbi:MAG: helix-turn-helix domain-containing protein [Anaerolineales bacterium]|jgi:sugar-specific transcriptional regulator TrmB
MDLKRGLTEIGFTEYEAKVYLALLGDNPATGYQISKDSGVPRSMVYETLSRLVGRGAVLESIEGRATLYRPVSPQLLLDRHEERQMRLIDNLREELQDVYTNTDEDHVWSIRNTSAVFTYAKQMLAEAKNEVYLVLNDEGLKALHEELAATSERGVSMCTLLTGQDLLPYGYVARHPPLESELQELTGTLMIVVDQAEALIADVGQETYATITKSNNLVLIARQFVWMELFAQRVYRQLGAGMLERLEPEDRQIFESLLAPEGGGG